jgi:S1-C subfamily serine protease
MSWMGAIAAMLVAGSATAIAAGDEDKEIDVERHEGKITIVRVDEDGNRHVETIEYDGDEPRAFLGVVTERVDEGGARITRVVDESAAEEAGLEKGDVIVGFDGMDIDGSTSLLRAVLGAEPGDRVDVEIERDGRDETVAVELGKRELGAYALALGDLEGHLEGLGERLGELDIHIPDIELPDVYLHDLHAFAKPKLGVELVQPTPELREHYGAPSDAGVIVGKLLEGMPAEDSGIRVGDVIVSANGHEIADAGDLVEVLHELDGEELELELIRDGRSIALDVYIPEEEDDTPSGPRA